MPYQKGINPKVNVIASLEIELAYYVVAVLHVQHNATRIPPIYLISRWGPNS